MRKRWIFVILAVILCAACIAVLMPREERIEKELTAAVYRDGQPLDPTAIRIDGVRQWSVLSDRQTFVGFFGIDYAPRTCRESMEATIRWDRGAPQFIVYSQYASYPDLDLRNTLLIDPQMGQVALGFQDGTVIATSESMYRQYLALATEH